MNRSLQVGEKIKTMRNKQKMTLKMLAKASNLSVGYLSNLERNLCSPTLENIGKICAALHSSLRELVLDSPKEERTLVRRDERSLVFDGDHDFTIQDVHFGTQKARYSYITITPNSPEVDLRWSHDFDEVGMILQGELKVWVEGELYHLFAEDSILIRANQSHTFYNDTDQECKSVWIQHKDTTNP